MKQVIKSVLAGTLAVMSVAAWANDTTNQQAQTAAEQSQQDAKAAQNQAQQAQQDANAAQDHAHQVQTQ